ncbi:MAG: hypothetical protein U9R53_10815 [Chloroflexota bacterium]|nr:hypothetical protein [Chloroflexota bacterium]
MSAAQFYASRLEWDEGDQTYHIRDVIGPDEYHEHVDDNALTNLMAGWVLVYAAQVADWLHEEAVNAYTSLLVSLSLTEAEVRSWPKIAEKIAITVRQDGVIEQFHGYFDLIYLDQKTLEPRETSLQNLFGIEGVQQYQFIKQPDVFRAIYLLRERYDRKQIVRNLNFYTPRTDLSQESSLGPSIQALMLARYGCAGAAKELFIKTLLTDMENNRGNSPDGIHAASAGVVWQVMLMGFLGLAVEDDTPMLNPALPKVWEKEQMKILWKDHLFEFDIL